MESTGVYWVPVYEILEQRGFEVFLVNARDAKHVPGRKTDVSDAQWLQRLHAYGLLDYAAAHVQHMQKALTLPDILRLVQQPPSPQRHRPADAPAGPLRPRRAHPPAAPGRPRRRPRPPCQRRRESIRLKTHRPRLLKLAGLVSRLR